MELVLGWWTLVVRRTLRRRRVLLWIRNDLIVRRTLRRRRGLLRRLSGLRLVHLLRRGALVMVSK